MEPGSSACSRRSPASLAALSLFGGEFACVMLRGRSDRSCEPRAARRARPCHRRRTRCVAISYEDPARATAKRIWIDARGESSARGLPARQPRPLAERVDAERRPHPAGTRSRPATVGSAAAAPAGRIVCNCFEVSETDIRAAVGRGADLSALPALAQMRNQLRVLRSGTAPPLRRSQLVVSGCVRKPAERIVLLEVVREVVDRVERLVRDRLVDELLHELAKIARCGLAACVISTAVTCSFGSTQK